ncbi:MAG TPA: hypothetical protein VGQ52_03345 [Gemmatimonadaceae bacterium]|jgi:hypothetical protein|nr:hypothetical protein [Gemmatimonadaceae bacterium]
MPRLARAWLALTTALALHVVDEASNDFLSFYNPMVLRLRERFSWFPMPTFEFWPWLVGLTLLVVFLFALTPSVKRGGRWVKIAGYPFAFIMLLNGIGHIAFSLTEGRMIAGVYTAPLLLAASLYMFRELPRASLSPSPGADR